MEWWIIGAILAIYMIIMIPVQYRNIEATKRVLKKSGKTHNEIYDEMSFEQQQMQYNLQSNFFHIPATLIAQFIYVLRHRKEKEA